MVSLPSVVILLAVVTIASFAKASPRPVDLLVDTLVKFFNAEDYSSVYDLLTPESQADLSRDVFIQELTTVQKILGLIKQYSPLYNVSRHYVYNFSFEILPMQANIVASKEDIPRLISFKLGKLVDRDWIPTFIKNNRAKTAIKINVNNKTCVNSNAGAMLPLASVFKTVIAINFAEQAAAEVINISSIVNLTKIERYNVNDLDTTKLWYDFIQKKGIVHDNAVTLLEVARGMILFSSNAATEYLQSILGLENIQKSVRRLNVTNHDDLFYLVSYLFSFKNFEGLRHDLYIEKLKQMSKREYIDRSIGVHEIFRNDKDGTFKNDISFLTLDIINIATDKFIASTADTYVEILAKINSRTYFDLKTQEVLDTVMEVLYKELLPKVYDVDFVHLGLKGGSSPSELTYASYSTDQRGVRKEMMYFLTGLSTDEYLIAQELFMLFNLSVHNDDEYMLRICKMLSSNRDDGDEALSSIDH